MLTDPIFKILSINSTEGLISAALEIDINHEIFNGHFPEQPVVPGACMVQLVKDILEKRLDKNLQLKIANNLKFLELINPQVITNLQLQLAYTIEDELIKVNGDLVAEDVVYFKFQGIYGPSSL
jgi:3-hydroxyacyl-[acyl-carrier-protein] dehydratase